MTDRLPRRHRLPGIVLAGCILFASIPLSPAMGLVDIPGAADEQPVAAAAVLDPEPVSDSRSPVAEMTVATYQRQAVAVQQAKTRALAATAAKKRVSLNVAGGNNSVTTGGPIPTTDVTPKTREIQGLVRKYFPADQVGNAMAVSACESGHADAVGATNSDGTTDWGVFQLNDGGTLQGALTGIGVSFGSTAEAQQSALDTETNVKAAASIYAGRGWAPWVCAYKIAVVAALYSNTPGPMAGKFDNWGNPTVAVPVVNVDPGAGNDPTTEPKPKPTPKPAPKPKPKPGGDKPGMNPVPKPKPTKTPKPTPEPTQRPTPEPEPTATKISPPPSQPPSSPAPSTQGGPTSG